MKTFCLIVLLASAAGLAARAGSNTNTAPQLRLTDIYSDNGFYDGNAHTVTYQGDVRVTGPDLKLTCALLVADLPEAGGRLDHALAETNVVIDVKDSKGRTVHATGQKAVYDYSVKDAVTNETITLTGDPQPQVQDSQGTQSANVITWDRAKNSFRFSGNYHFSALPNGAPVDTNAPAATTNELSAAKLPFPPGTDTNYPPGSLDLIPTRLPGGGGRGGGGGHGF